MTLAEQVEAKLAKQMQSLDEPLGSVCAYALQGGRRVRAGLLLAAAADAGNQAVKAAAAVELMHTATLLQDDIFDAGQTRRGRTSTHLRFGNAQAILASDWLLVASLELAAEVGPNYFRCLAHVAMEMTQAEAMELTRSVPQTLEEARRSAFEIARGKTGSLFGAALCGAATALGLAPAQCAEWQDLGNDLGLTYQLVDDCIDSYDTESHAGKSVGHDLAAGCLPMPVMLGAAALASKGRALALGEIRGGRLNAEACEALLAEVHSSTVKDELRQVLEQRVAMHVEEAARVGLADASIHSWMGRLLDHGRTCLVRRP